VTRARIGSVLLAALVLVSTVAVGFGPGLATAQTDTYAQEFTTGPHKVEIDLSNVTTETTISVITSESPAEDNATIMKKTVAGSKESAHFRNAGAYETFTVQVAGADAKPGFSKGGVTAAWTPGDSGKFLGDTGGDAGFTYDLSESVGESLQPEIIQLDRTGLPDDTAVNTTGTDAEQTKIDIYQSAQTQHSQADNYQTTVDNYLSDTKTQARIIGKNAYIRALNNGSSKSAAKTDAKQAVADYYSVKQVNLMNEYEAESQNYQYIHDVATQESGITSSWEDNHDTFVGSNHTHPSNDGGTFNFTGLVDVNHQLVNGSSNTYQAPKVFLKGNFEVESNPTLTAHTAPSTVEAYDGTSNSNGIVIHSLVVRPPNSNYDALPIVQWKRYNEQAAEIESQNTQVQNDMDTLAENTYSAYQQGEINSSDLVDPYVLANERSAGDNFETWSAAQLTLLGQNTPDNMDSAGEFEVETSDGTTYEGILTSPSNPASGQFEADTTYNTADIDGSQMVITEDRIVELDGEFTLGNITTNNGENVQNATIQKVQYETTNITELKQQYEDLAYRRAELEAREQAMKQAGGGGLLGGESVNTTAAIVIVALVLALGIINN